MSDEEKKAIEELWHFDCAYNREIKIVLNLIEKQSKEIEELKNKNKKLQDKAKELIFEKQELTSALLDSIPNDKIKAKIEYKKDKLRQIQNFNDRYRIMCLQVEIDILQSLLEKE